MSVTAPEQLSLDVGGEAGAFVKSAFTMSGKVESYTDVLDREENVTVRLVDEAGEVIFEADGWVSRVAIETIPRNSTFPKHTLRTHTVKLGERAPATEPEEE